MMIRMVGGWMFFLVTAHPGSPGQRAVKQLLMLLLLLLLAVYRSAIGRQLTVLINWFSCGFTSHSTQNRCVCVWLTCLSRDEGLFCINASTCTARPRGCKLVPTPRTSCFTFSRLDKASWNTTNSSTRTWRGRQDTQYTLSHCCLLKHFWDLLSLIGSRTHIACLNVHAE